MKEERLPVVILGTSSMSYGIRKILRKEGIEVVACWTNNYKGTEEIDGIPVMNFDAIVKKYKIFIVVFGHSKYELADSVVQNPAVHRCFCLVNMCYGQWKHLSYDFVKNHIEDYFWTYEELEDDLSKESLIGWLNRKSTEDFHYLLPVCREKTLILLNHFLKLELKRVLLILALIMETLLGSF